MKPIANIPLRRFSTQDVEQVLEKVKFADEFGEELESYAQESIPASPASPKSVDSIMESQSPDDFKMIFLNFNELLIHIKKTLSNLKDEMCQEISDQRRDEIIKSVKKIEATLIGDTGALFNDESIRILKFESILLISDILNN